MKRSTSFLIIPYFTLLHKLCEKQDDILISFILYDFLIPDKLKVINFNSLASTKESEKNICEFEKASLGLLIISLALTPSFDLIAQEKETDGVADFKIAMEKTENGITLRGIEEQIK